MPRKYIPGWSSARREAIKLSNGLCAKCKCDVVASGRKIEVNHKRAIVDGGDPIDQDNLEVLCKETCHREHSAEVVKRNAKIKRIAAKHAGTAKERKFKKKVQSRPMQKGYRPVNPKNRDKPMDRRGKMS